MLRSHPTSSLTYPQNQDLHSFWFPSLGGILVVRPLSRRLWILDWVGHLLRTRTGS